MSVGPRLAIVMAFYRNRLMLAEHYARWSCWPEAIRDQVEVVIVDDGSPPGEDAASVPLRDGLPALRIYRFLEDRPWNQDAARNLGAHRAVAPWLLLTDMDHAVPDVTARAVLERTNAGCIYTFNRVDAPFNTLTRDARGRRKPHCNSFAMTRELFWRIGGYDETYSGKGIYGTDGLFLRRAHAAAPFRHLSTPLVRYPRTVIGDASTTTLSRDRAAKRALTPKPPGAPIEILTQPWERVL